MKSVLILLLFIGVALNVNAGDEIVFCQYYNDPHLIPFPLSPGGYQGQYLCRNNCTEIMLRNDFVEIFVTADPQGEYPIVQYTVVFFPTASNTEACALTDSFIDPSPVVTSCSPTSVVTSTNPSPGYFVHYHNEIDITVEIWTRGTWFNIRVDQPFSLIAQSTGVCVKWDCKEERGGGRGRKKRQNDPDAVFTKIIDLYVNSALKQALGPVSASLVNNLRTAVLTDLRATYNSAYFDVIVSTILRSSVGASGSQDELRGKIEKAGEVAQKIICNNVDSVNEIIVGSPNCKVINGVQKCLEPVRPAGC